MGELMGRAHTLRCPKGRHPLAWLEVREGQAAVVVRAISPGRDQRTVSEVRVSADELRGRLDEDQEAFASFRVVAACSCDSGRFSVDLVAVLEGRTQTPIREWQDYRDLGVSFDR